MINLKPLYNGETDEISFSFELFPKNLPIDIKFDKSLLCDGKIYVRARGKSSNDSLFELQININGIYKSICSRCAADIEKKFSKSEIYTIASNLQSEENEYIIDVKNAKLDLEELCETVIILNLPTTNLCKQDCLGLCSECGANLNYEKCSCLQKKIDPRLAILQKLLDKE